jgi:hypothetical protein
MQRNERKPNLLIRACPRCRGDLYRDLLENEEEFVCLQCGRRAGQTPIDAAQRPARSLRRVA